MLYYFNISNLDLYLLRHNHAANADWAAYYGESFEDEQFAIIAQD